MAIGREQHLGRNIKHEPSGLIFTAVTKNFRQAIKSNLVGGHNVSNILAALGATIYGLDLSPQTAADGVESLTGIPGRSEQFIWARIL